MHVGLAGAVDVVGITSLAGEEAHVLAPFGARAYSAVFGHPDVSLKILSRGLARVGLRRSRYSAATGFAPISAAAARMDLTMLW